MRIIIRLKILSCHTHITDKMSVHVKVELFFHTGESEVLELTGESDSCCRHNAVRRALEKLSDRQNGQLVKGDYNHIYLQGTLAEVCTRIAEEIL